MDNIIIDPKFKTPHNLEDELIYLYMLNNLPKHQCPKRLEQKLMFLVEYTSFLNNDKIIYLNYEKRQFGPMSRQLSDIRRRFTLLKIVKPNPKPYFDLEIELVELTENGIKIYEEIEDIYEENNWIQIYIDPILEKWGESNAYIFTEKYIDTLPLNNQIIGEYKPGDLLEFNYTLINHQFKLNKDWIETINLILKPGFFQDLDRLKNKLEHIHMIPFQPL